MLKLFVMINKKYFQINVNFRPRDYDLLYWIRAISNGNESKVGRDAFEIYRLFNGSLEMAQRAKEALEREEAK